MIKHKTLLVAAMCVTTLALPATAATAVAPAAAAKPLGSSWADVTKLPDFFSGNWQSVTTFLDRAATVPFTAKAQAHIAQYKPIEDIAFAGAGCKTPGMPIVQRVGSPLKFFYQPGMIAIYIENTSMTRFIKLNGKHSERPNPTFLGESIGHFEGDTLVVDSVGFADDVVLQYTTLPGQGTGSFILPPEVVFGPHGPNLRMVERLRLVDSNTLEIQLTIHDDTVWKGPYVSNPVQIFKRNGGDDGWPNEWVCSSAPDPLEFDPATNRQVIADPAEILKKLQQNEDK